MVFINSITDLLFKGFFSLGSVMHPVILLTVSFASLVSHFPHYLLRFNHEQTYIANAGDYVETLYFVAENLPYIMTFFFLLLVYELSMEINWSCYFLIVPKHNMIILTTEDFANRIAHERKKKNFWDLALVVKTNRQGSHSGMLNGIFRAINTQVKPAICKPFLGSRFLSFFTPILKESNHNTYIRGFPILCLF